MSKTLTLTAATLSTLHPGQEPTQTLHADLMQQAFNDSRLVAALAAPLNLGMHNLYAQHRSHRSHSSHSSHRSHYSGSGGSYRPYTPPPSPAPYVSPAPSSSSSSASSSLAPSQSLSADVFPTKRASQDELKLMIMRVQAALFARGYDPGGIDGTLGPQTRVALELFQSRSGLNVTGTMSTATLDALGIKLSP